MNTRELSQLTSIATGDKWKVRPDLLEWLKGVEVVEEVKGAPERTDAQSRALFLWFGLIEHEAENQGVTWNMIIEHTHQLRITKEGLHIMAKQLMQALWGLNSTKKLKKTGQLDILIDHFVDLFSKVGLEVPPFPENLEKTEEGLGGYKLSQHDIKIKDYPELDKMPEF